MAGARPHHVPHSLLGRPRPPRLSLGLTVEDRAGLAFPLSPTAGLSSCILSHGHQQPSCGVRGMAQRCPWETHPRPVAWRSGAPSGVTCAAVMLSPCLHPRTRDKECLVRAAGPFGILIWAITQISACVSPCGTRRPKMTFHCIIFQTLNKMASAWSRSFSFTRENAQLTLSRTILTWSQRPYLRPDRLWRSLGFRVGFQWLFCTEGDILF
jgi:hypothetical protein